MTGAQKDVLKAALTTTHESLFSVATLIDMLTEVKNDPERIAYAMKVLGDALWKVIDELPTVEWIDRINADEED